MKFAFCTCVLLFAAVSQAQPTGVVLSWRFSVDGGNSWSPDAITLPESTLASVLVQGIVSWQSNTSTADGFVSLSFDPFVQRTSGSGVNDWIKSPLLLANGGLAPRPGIAVSAFQGLLKIDRDTDLLPPGLGPNWVTPAQTPVFEGFNLSNPIPILSYSYTLDGTPGVRTVSSAIAQRSDETNAQFFDADIGVSTPIYVPVTQLPATITVIPAPSPLAAILLAGLLASRRRRS